MATVSERLEREPWDMRIKEQRTSHSPSEHVQIMLKDKPNGRA